jgi:hypothetical protein
MTTNAVFIAVALYFCVELALYLGIWLNSRREINQAIKKEEVDRLENALNKRFSQTNAQGHMILWTVAVLTVSDRRVQTSSGLVLRRTWMVKESAEKFWKFTASLQGNMVSTFEMPLSEKDVRTALFNHPTVYERAFGEISPAYQAKLNARVPLAEKLNKFDPKLHGGELMATTPLGKEIGAKTP